MLPLSIILFIVFCAWESLASAQRQSNGLALAQLSRSKTKRSTPDGVVQVSPINRPEDLAFEPPPAGHLGVGSGDGSVELFSGLKLLDTVLLAGIDGRFHALNRTNGRVVWSMEDDVETGQSQTSLLHNLVRTDHNLPLTSTSDLENNELYIIEPQSGDIFILDPESGVDKPLRRLPYSVPQLVEHSPFSFDDPNRVFVGKKETSIIEIDLDEGIVKSVMGGTSHWTNEARGPDDEDDDEYPRRGRRTVQIGRTDYTIKVIARNVVLQTLVFSTYQSPNQHKPLQSLYKRTPDDIYLQPSWDGQTYAFEIQGESALWGQAFRNPIVAVFDVVIPDTIMGAGSDGVGTGVGVEGSGKPIVLLQPRPRLQELFPTRAAAYGEMKDKAVINRIGDSLYAMGHLNYPLVNLAVIHLAEIEGSSSEAEEGEKERCEGVNCYVGVKYAELEGPLSRVSRLIEPPPASGSEHVTTRDTNKNNALPEEPRPVPTIREDAAIPFPSRLSSSLSPLGKENFISLLSQLENNRPKPKTPAWTLILPFVGGFLAIWFILRKFMKLNSDPRNELVRPLQDPSSSLEARSSLTPGRHSRNSSSVHPAFIGTSTASVSTAVASPRAEQQEFHEKQGIQVELSEKVDPDVNLSISLDDPRGGPGLGVPVDIAKEGEESEKDEEDPKDGKKKTRRRNRGKKNKKTVAQAAEAEAKDPRPEVPGAASTSTESGSSVGGYVMVEKEEQAETPMPPTTSPSSLVVGNKILGYGSHGTIVYEGALQGRAVAVKRLLQDFTTLASHEVSLLLQADDHPNVIRYFFSMTRESFLYIALELCPCSLADLIETPSKHPEIMVTFEPKRALSQITQGLRHLHSLKIVHRDIKPQNILVSGRKGDGSHRMLISDFGLCKKLEVDQTSFLPTMAAGAGHGVVAAGTPGWRAPEILRGDVSLDEETGATDSSRGGSRGDSSNGNSRASETRLTKSVDIFALGCLFYYTLVNGEHPFGEKYIREINILGGKFNLIGLEKFGEEGVEAQHLIERMVDQDSKARPNTDTILLHPFFWTPARRLTFLQDASDRFEIMEREPREAGLIALETGAFDVVGSDWHKRLDKVFIDNLGKYRKYQGGSVQDLMRALRNKKHHYQDLPDNVKRHLGPLPDGFLSYFTRRFPNLLMHVHTVISELPLCDEPMFKTYFELEH